MQFEKDKWYLPREILRDVIMFSCEFEVRHKLYVGQYNNGEFIGVLASDKEGPMFRFTRQEVRRFKT